MKKKIAEGFTCECGERYKYPAYVYAHWDASLTHTCDACQRKHSIICGVATLIGAPKKKAKTTGGTDE